MGFERWIKLFFLVTLLPLGGCGDRNGDFGFEIKGMDSRISGRQLEVALTQKISLSAEARNALQNGVPLHLEVRAELDTPQGDTTATRRFEIRYLPLSDHFQLSSGQPAVVHTFPRLRHVLAELSSVELTLPLQDIDTGTYQLKARIWLEKRKLPAPMRLPAWFAPNWQHDSGWQSWAVSIEPGSAALAMTASS